MKRYIVEAIDQPLGPSGVFHLHEGDYAMKQLHKNQWIVDRVKWTCDDGFGTDKGLDLVSWVEQGKTHIKITNVTLKEN